MTGLFDGRAAVGLRVVVGSDDNGDDYRKIFAADLRADPRVAEVIDVVMAGGEHYPDVAYRAARLIADGRADRALLFCGTGMGMAISANKAHRIRAVSAHDSYSVERAVLSYDAQVLCLGQRIVGVELARRLVREWLGYTWDPQGQSVAGLAALDDYDC